MMIDTIRQKIENEFELDPSEKEFLVELLTECAIQEALGDVSEGFAFGGPTRCEWCAECK